ncbi:hypothetical protein [Streptococcus sp. DD12]|uniref:hypothetical protein n=1 Tax=Streptococcus sp. DD12 TaxID=1777880 RepID=UPI000794C1AC|nr:hypothetical protein [Streptococcus sp. DD12]KXT75344.1 hypothetical protein STRDD12_01465 [Streptococcus sp. DD12]
MLFDDPDLLTWEEWLGQFEMVNERLPKLEEIQQGRVQKGFHSDYSDEELLASLPAPASVAGPVGKKRKKLLLGLGLPVLLALVLGLVAIGYYQAGVLQGNWHSNTMSMDFKKMRGKSAASYVADSQQASNTWVKPEGVALESHRNIVRLTATQTIDKKAVYQNYVAKTTADAQKKNQEATYFSYEAWLSFFDQQRAKDAEKLGGSYDAKKGKLTVVLMTLRYNSWTREMEVIGVNSEFNLANAFGNYHALSEVARGERFRYQKNGRKLSVTGDQLTLLFTKDEEKE